MYNEFTKNMNIKIKDVTVKHWRDIVEGTYNSEKKTLGVLGAGTVEYKKDQMDLALKLADDLISGKDISQTESTLGTYKEDMNANPFTILTMVFTINWKDYRLPPIDVIYKTKLGYMYGKTYIYEEELSFGFEKKNTKLIYKLEAMLAEDNSTTPQSFDPFASDHPKNEKRPHLRIEADDDKKLLRAVLRSTPILERKNIYISDFLSSSLVTIYTEIVEKGFLC